MRLEAIGNLMTFSAAIFVLITEDIDAGDVGLIITYALQITQENMPLTDSASHISTVETSYKVTGYKVNPDLR